MSVQQICTSKEIISVVPDARKAEAVKRCIEGDSSMAPDSILRTYTVTTIYLDAESAHALHTVQRSAPSLAGPSRVPLLGSMAYSDRETVRMLIS
jgi:hypothetical protein